MDRLFVFTYGAALTISLVNIVWCSIIYLNNYKIILPFLGWCFLDSYLLNNICNKDRNLTHCVINSIHAGFISLFASLFVMDNTIETIYKEAHIISFSYFLYDFCILYNSEIKKKLKLQLYFHHVILLYNSLPLFYKSFNTLDEHYFKISSILYLSELTNIPLNISWVLNEKKQNNTLLFKISSISTLVLYIPFRFMTTTYALYYLYIYSYFNSYMFFTFIFNLLNLYWYYRMIIRFTKIKHND